MKQDKVTVIIPAYNASLYIEDCLDSVFKQSYQNFEVICINDGSTDNTLEILENYKNNSHEFILENIKNSGPSYARNIGITKSTGKFLTFLDSDDRLDVDFLKKMIDNSKNNDLVVCGISKEQKKLEITSADKICDKDTYYIKMIHSVPGSFSVCNKLFKADIIKEHSIIFDKSINHAEDCNFVLDYLSHVAGNIMLIKDCLYNYRLVFGSITNNTEIRFIENHIKWKKIMIEKIPAELIETHRVFLEKYTFEAIVSTLNQDISNEKDISISNLKQKSNINFDLRFYNILSTGNKLRYFLIKKNMNLLYKLLFYLLK